MWNLSVSVYVLIPYMACGSGVLGRHRVGWGRAAEDPRRVEAEELGVVHGGKYTASVASHDTLLLKISA